MEYGAPMMIKIASFNVNGIRAAVRKGLPQWLVDNPLDYICVQETKAQMNAGLKSSLKLQGYHGYFADAKKPGYSGVGIFTRQVPLDIRTVLGYALADEEGRFIELEFDDFILVSLYLPSGTSGQVRQDCKMAMLAWFERYYLQLHIKNSKPRVICGDWNIAHTEQDLKNWRQNQRNSGFLPEERRWLDRIFLELGWVDAYRVLHPATTEYTWWSYRGQARANNAGWRIDYQVVSPELKEKICAAYVCKDPIFSDHAPLIIAYTLV